MQMVQMQQQQAAQAAEANKERNARLSYGVNLINSMFQGRPSDSKLLDTSGIGRPPPPPPPPPPPTAADVAASTVGGGAYALPTGFTKDPNTGALVPPSVAPIGTPFQPYNPVPAVDMSGQTGTLADGYSWKPLPDSGGSTQYGIFDPSGNLVTSAGSLSDLSKAQIYYGGSTGPGTTTTGGFGDDFYNKFRQSILDYYLPQEDEQYANARTGLNYNLARAGSLNSSVAAMDVGKLSEQDTMNRAQIASQADTQTAGLRTQVQQDQQQALNQLYSTEDPSVAANTAQNMVANANLTVPLLNPVGALFAPITAGVGNAISGFMNPYAYITGGGGAGGMGTGSVASTPSPSSGTGISGAV